MEISSRLNVHHRESSLQSPTELVQCRREIFDFLPLRLGRLVYYAHVFWQ